MLVLFWLDWHLALVTLVILPAMLVVTSWFRRGAREGFRNYPMEWWHFTLQPEPTPDTQYDVPVR